MCGRQRHDDGTLSVKIVQAYKCIISMSLVLASRGSIVPSHVLDVASFNVRIDQITVQFLQDMLWFLEFIHYVDTSVISII